MHETVECIRCHAHMERGYVVGADRSGYKQQTWSPGEPEPSFWMGLKLNADSLLPVITLRCSGCGYLESYAIAPAISDR
jgi:hypothetical protein